MVSRVKPGDPLTAKQQQIWDLKNAGKTNAEVAAIFGISVTVVEKQVTAIYKRLGKPGSPLTVIDHASAVDTGLTKVNQAMLDAGLPERLRASHIRRLKVKHTGEITPVQAITDEAMKSQIREKVALAFSYMDDKAMSESSFRDLSVGTTTLIEKLQLLEGKPTQIVSDLERKKLVELMPLLAAEAKRRGVTLDGQVTEKVVTPA